MKTFQIILISGLNSKFRAENQVDLLKKIDTGHFGILPVRGRERVVISRSNIKEIIELEDVE